MSERGFDNSHKRGNSIRSADPNNPRSLEAFRNNSRNLIQTGASPRNVVLEKSAHAVPERRLVNGQLLASDGLYFFSTHFVTLQHFTGFSEEGTELVQIDIYILFFSSVRNMTQNHKKSPGGPITSNVRVAAQCNFGVLKKKRKRSKLSNVLFL